MAGVPPLVMLGVPAWLEGSASPSSTSGAMQPQPTQPNNSTI
jgi:hypothetical protein